MKRPLLARTALAALLGALLATPAMAQTDIVTDMVSLRIQLRGQMIAESSDFGTGNDRLGSRTDLRLHRFRITFTGMFDSTYGFMMNTHSAISGTKSGIIGHSVSSADTDFNDSGVRLLDAYFIANYNKAVNFKFGLTKIPMTRMNLDGCFDPLGVDRSMWAFTGYGSSPIKASRDMGVNMWGKLFGGRSVYQLAAFQGREGFARTTHPFSGASVTSSQTPGNTLLYVGRLHYSLLETEADGSGYQGSYLGDRKVLTFGVGMGHESDAVYKNVTSAGAVSNEETVDYNAMTADMFFEYPTSAGTVTLTSAYTKVDFDDVYKTNLNPGDLLTNYGGVNGQKDGFYVKGAFLLPQNVGKEGKLQPYGYYEKFDVAALAGVKEQTVTQKALGVVWYLRGQNVRFTAEYLKNEFAKPTGLVGGRVNASFQPIDLVTDNTSMRAMFQVAF
ncbi:MAG: selenite/tellurite reduction operon porin ExtI [Gemmatimonadota bacterium]|nr:selenite/tellurite reduction operon porin ExtI [Gemmatimonadota bacterium]